MAPAARRLIVLLAAAGIAGGVVVACDSFEESPPSPATPDASEDAPSGSDAVSSVDGASDGGATTSCVPEPVEPYSAAEDAGCGPNGATVQLTIDRQNCGFCGNNCGEGTCLNSRCQAPGFGTGYATPITVGNADATNGLWFAVNEDGCNATHIRRFDVADDAGPPDKLYVNGGCANGVVVRGDKLYYVRNTSGLHVTELTNPTHVDPALLVSTYIGLVHVGASAIFFSDTNYNYVRLMSFAGAQGEYVHQDVTTRLYTAYGDGDQLWWVVGPPEPGTPTEALWTHQIGKSTYKILGDLVGARAMTVDADYVYLGFLNGEVARVPRNGQAPLERIAYFDPGQAYPRALAVAGDSLFIVGGSAQAASNGAFDLFRVKKCGGRARLIGGGYMLGNAFTIVGKYGYYPDIAALRRFDLSRWLP